MSRIDCHFQLKIMQEVQVGRSSQKRFWLSVTAGRLFVRLSYSDENVPVSLLRMKLLAPGLEEAWTDPGKPPSTPNGGVVCLLPVFQNIYHDTIHSKNGLNHSESSPPWTETHEGSVVRGRAADKQGFC